MAQSSLILSKSLRLPKDTTLQTALINSINRFLNEKEKANSVNTAILKENLVATSVLLDEFKKIERSEKFKDSLFYKCQLISLVELDSLCFLVQLSYNGISENAVYLRAIFKLLVQKRDNSYYISSPLAENTADWKKTVLGNKTIYAHASFDPVKTKNYFKTIDAFDKKLNSPVKQETFFFCENFTEAQHVLGIDYKSDFNGRNSGVLSANENNHFLHVDGYFIPEKGNFDPHDLWHSRLRQVLPANRINRPVDEGTAYLYGGSWGFSWEEILQKFKTFAKNNPEANWLELYNESKNFDEKAKYPLNVDFVINALIVRKIEREKGFNAVLDLLACGPKEKGNVNYFLALEKITGITKDNFNATVNVFLAEK